MKGWTGCGIVTLLSDFGSTSSYPGSLRGSVLSVSREVTLVDITHDVPAYDIMAGALILRAAAPAFPRGTVHLAVVDPGVGSARRAIAVFRRGHVFVGPDNGLFAPFLDDAAVVTRIDEKLAAVGPVSPTFPGRDLFAPAAARIASGVDPGALGGGVADSVRLSWPEPEIRGATIAGVVIHVDRFGNLIANIDAPGLGNRTLVRIRDTEVVRRRTYADAAPGTLLALVGSGGLLEIAEALGHAAVRLGAVVGDPVEALS